MTDKAIRSALMTAKRVDTKSENIADYVADLLRQGRASEVTDDLMAQADPQRLYQHYTSGNTGMDLPMDYASRMERAARMGFKNREYHGTDVGEHIVYPSGFHNRGSRAGTGFWTSNNPYVASTYADAQHGTVMPFMTRDPSSGISEVEAAGRHWSDIPKENKVTLPSGHEITVGQYAVGPADVGGVHDTNQIARGAALEGHGGVRFKNVMDFGISAPDRNIDPVAWQEFMDKSAEPSDVTARQDTRGIRSQFARFDPRLEHLAHLNASTGGAMEFARHVEAVHRAGGQIAPSKYLPDVPRQVHAGGGRIGKDYGGALGYVPQYQSQQTPHLAVAPIQQQAPRQDQGPSPLETLANLMPQSQPTPEATTASTQGVSSEAQAALDALRKNWTGQSFNVISDYRDPAENQRVGGAKGSQHLSGNAFDVDTHGWTPEQKLALAEEARRSGFRGFGFYDNNMHFDVGPARTWGPSYHHDSVPDWAQGFADGGPVDLNHARALKNFNTDGPTPEAANLLNSVSSRMQASHDALQEAKSAGAFDNVRMGDVWKKRGSASSPGKVVAIRMTPAERWKSATKVFSGHYPTVDLQSGSDVNSYPLELLEDSGLYDRIAGPPRIVKENGGSITAYHGSPHSFDAALALTRRFTKDGKAATVALKSKGK